MKVPHVSIFKPKRRSRAADPWLLAWTDARGKRRVKSSSTRRRIAEREAERISERLDLARARLIDPHAERYVDALARALDAHVGDYERYLRAKGDTTRHAAETARCIRRVCDALEIAGLGELEADRVQGEIGTLRDQRRRPDEHGSRPACSLRTKDKHVRAFKGFGRWLHRVARRVPANPMDFLEHYSADRDPRHVRRVEDADVVGRLVEATERGPTRGRVSGVDRAMLYRLLYGTGLRYGTVIGLRREDFRLDDPAGPWLNVVATNTKERRRHRHEISRELADVLRPWLAGRAHGAPVLRRMARPADVLKRDLKAAGIEYRDAAGHVLDLHAFRNAFITEVIRTGGLKVAQDLAHHSTPVLTAKYARIGAEDRRRAVEALPKLSARGAARGRIC